MRRPGVAPAATALLMQARAVLSESVLSDDAGERFRLAHLAALRTAAALFAARGRPTAGRRKLVSAWELLERMSPEFAEWAAYFAAAAPIRAAVEAGAIGTVAQRAADDQLRAAQDFARLVAAALDEDAEAGDPGRLGLLTHDALAS